MHNIPKPIPKNLFEIDQSQINPYLSSLGIPVSDVQNLKSNRSIDYSMRNDKVKDISIGLEDIDGAIMFYFNNIIKPTVIQDNNRVDVNVIYGNPERWKSIQQDGFLRDGNGQITVPIIVLKRGSVGKSRDLGNKLDGNNAALYQVVGESYNPRNSYDKFDLLNNRIPSKQYYVSTVPDYLTLTYDCIIYTNFVEQNNKIVEAVEFASDSYWGDPSRFKFRASIDSFSTPVTIENGGDRVAKSAFTIKVNGYIIPDTINKDLATIRSKFYTKSQIIFDLEVVDGGDVDTVQFANKPPTNNLLGATSFIGGNVNITNNTTIITGSSTVDLDYLNTNIAKIANGFIVPTVAVFTNVNILQPSSGSSLPATTNLNFTFYVNGQYVPSALVTLTENEQNVIATFDTGSMLFDLEIDDEVTAIGKFVELVSRTKYIFTQQTGSISNYQTMIGTYGESLTTGSVIDSYFGVGNPRVAPMFIAYSSGTYFISESINVDTTDRNSFLTDINGWLWMNNINSASYDSLTDKYVINDNTNNTYIYILSTDTDFYQTLGGDNYVTLGGDNYTHN